MKTLNSKNLFTRVMSIFLAFVLVFVGVQFNVEASESREVRFVVYGENLNPATTLEVYTGDTFAGTISGFKTNPQLQDTKFAGVKAATVKVPSDVTKVNVAVAGKSTSTLVELKAGKDVWLNFGKANLDPAYSHTFNTKVIYRALNNADNYKYFVEEEGVKKYLTAPLTLEGENVEGKTLQVPEELKFTFDTLAEAEKGMFTFGLTATKGKESVDVKYNVQGTEFLAQGTNEPEAVYLFEGETSPYKYDVLRKVTFTVENEAPYKKEVAPVWAVRKLDKDTDKEYLMKVEGLTETEGQLNAADVAKVNLKNQKSNVAKFMKPVSGFTNMEFHGWYEKSTANVEKYKGVKAVSETTKFPEGGLVVYGKFYEVVAESQKFTLTVDPNGGKVKADKQEVKFEAGKSGQLNSVDSLVLVKDGYKLTGFELSDKSKVVYRDDAHVLGTGNAIVKDVLTKEEYTTLASKYLELKGSIVLKAVWEEIKGEVQVSLNSDDDTVFNTLNGKSLVLVKDGVEYPLSNTNVTLAEGQDWTAQNLSSGTYKLVVKGFEDRVVNIKSSNVNGSFYRGEQAIGVFTVKFAENSRALVLNAELTQVSYNLTFTVYENGKFVYRPQANEDLHPIKLVRVKKDGSEEKVTLTHVEGKGTYVTSNPVLGLGTFRATFKNDHNLTKDKYLLVANDSEVKAMNLGKGVFQFTIDNSSDFTKKAGETVAQLDLVMNTSKVGVVSDVLVKDDGSLTKGWAKVDNKWYFFNEKGIKQTGWVYASYRWYYLNAEGVMQEGFVKVDGMTYYLHPMSGHMATGWAKVDGNWYFFNNSGSMKTGWAYVAHRWYFLGENGVMKTGWLMDKGVWYYLRANGDMATGWVKVGGNWYYLTVSGAMANSDRVVEGRMSKFAPSGKWLGYAN